MQTFFKTLTVVAAVFFCSLNTNAQQILNQVIVLNEGRFDYILQQIDKPVTVGTYNPLTNVYSVFDTIDGARFATDVQVDDAYIYVAADAKLLKYDLNTLQLLASQNVPGIRRIALWNNQILLTRGEYGVNYNSYFQVYNKSDLSFSSELDTLNGPSFSTDGILVKDDVAYIAINNGFVWGGAVGIVGRVDLTTQNYLPEISLGADGINPENIMLSNNKIYTLNNKDYTNASISTINISNSNVATTNLNNAGGCQGSALVTNHIAYQTASETFLGRFDLNAQSISDSLMINRTIYGMGSDVLNHLLYVSETDFTSYGLILIYTETGNLLNAFVAGVTPGKFAFDYRNVSATNDINSAKQILVYPNPAKDVITIAATSQKENTQIVITDMLGRTVYTSVNAGNFVQHIDVKTWSAGNYFLTVSNGENISTQKISVVK